MAHDLLHQAGLDTLSNFQQTMYAGRFDLSDFVVARAPSFGLLPILLQLLLNP